MFTAFLDTCVLWPSLQRDFLSLAIEGLYRPIWSGAGAIITHNIRDFPPHRLPAHLEVLKPKDFAANTVALSPARARTAVETIATRSGVSGPVLTAERILDTLLRRYEMDQAVELIRQVPL